MPKSRKRRISGNKPPGRADKLTKLFYSWVRKSKRTSVAKVNPLPQEIDQFKIEGLLCEGTFGKIVRGIHKVSKFHVAIKLELIETLNPQLYIEYKIYELLGCERDGFIKIFHYGPIEKYNALAMELLGPDLDDLLVMCDGKFSHKTVLLIAMQTIKIIEFVHEKGIIYRDIKPENFCIGTRVQNKDSIIHIIDFGLSKIVDLKQHQSETPHIDYDYLVGTARYMSINAHYGVEQSKRDDLESLGYMYMYFLNGRLPWMGLSRIEDVGSHYQAIAEQKVRTKPEDIIQNYQEFINYMYYVKQLEFNSEPDYEYIITQFRKVYEKKEYDKEFDWTAVMKKKYLEQFIEVDPDDV